MNRTVKNIIVYSVALGVFAGMGGGLYWYQQYTKQQNQKKAERSAEQAQADALKQIPKVKVVQIFPIPLTDYLVLPGTVKPYADIDLAAKIGGTVKSLGAREGQRVEQGMKLLVVDTQAVSTKQAEVRARYEQARRDYERTKRLYDESIASKGQLDNAKTQLDSAKSGLDSMALTLVDGTLTSPIAGILERLNVDVGESINPGQTVMKIVDIDRVLVELPIPEKDILYFNVGQSVTIDFERPNSAPLKLTGAIEVIATTADPANRTYLIKVAIENPEHTLRPGMIVRANLVRRDIAEAIAVPFFTIIDRQDGKGVFVVEGGLARARTIQYGVLQRGLVEITSGLQAGESLVVVGQRGLIDGEKVEVVADVTELTKLWLRSGKELSDIPAELLR